MTQSFVESPDLERGQQPGVCLPLTDLQKQDLSQAGAKAVNLGILSRAGLAVPKGFVITTAAFRQFVQSTPGWGALEAELLGLCEIGLEEIKELAARLRAALGSTPITVEAQAAVRQTIVELGRTVKLWAVRSSATLEDTDASSFAGQHDTFLQVPEEEILERVKSCWISAFSTRALQYRLQRHPGRSLSMAVIVQEMIPTEVSGVTFTVDPGTGENDRMVIEYVQGLGTKLVEGRVVPQRIVLAKASLKILERNAGSVPGLGRREIRLLGKLGRNVEGIMAGAQDIEWACANGRIHLLQARPVTTRVAERSWADRQVWTNINASENLPEVVTPMTWSVVLLLIGPLFRSMFRLLGARCEPTQLMGLVAGRAYFSVNAGLAILKRFSFMAPGIPELTTTLGGFGGLTADTLLRIPDKDLPDLNFKWSRYLLSFPQVLANLIACSPRRADVWTAKLNKRSAALAEMSINHLTAAELGALFTRVAPECFQDWDFMYIFTHATALPVFQYACKHWLNDPQLSVGYKLFAGSDQLPEARVGRVLWNLAKLAGDDPVIRQTIGTEEPWSAIEPRLRATPNGVQFLAQWNDFMIQHGHHAYGELELANARWAERPDYVLGILRNLLANPNHPDLGESQRQRYLESKRLEEECCLRLRNPFKCFVFLWSLRRARRLSALREEWKDQAVKLLAHFRRMLLRLGELLVNRGVLESADDVFFLEYSQIQPVSSGDSGFDAKTLVAQRRKEFLANQQLNPPPIVFGTFKGEAQSLPARNEAGTCLKGIPTSPGIVKGRARVMMRSDTLEPFAAGEILVAPFTDPSWTPYFVSAAAVVTDSGGILSHGSIVAREYGIPAVISVFDATRLIQTGDWLEVDGYRGVVTKLTRGIVTG